MPALLVALLLAAAPTASAGSAAGLYEIDQMEMAGGLELRPDGRFRYALEYGAVSEEGTGKWRQQGEAVLLTSDPMPKAPDFEVVRDDPAPAGVLTLQMEPHGFASYPLDALVKLRGSREVRELDLDENGAARLPPSASPELIIPEVPVYGGFGSPIPLSAERGHRLLLRFLPNDLGKARFDGEKLAREGDDLVLYRYDAKIRFHPRPR